MRVRLIALLAWILSGFGCADPEVDIHLDEQTATQLAALPGKLGIKLETQERNWHFEIEQGVVRRVNSFPPAPKEAKSITPDISAQKILSSPEHFVYRGPYIMNQDATRIAAAIVYKDSYIYKASALAIANAKTGAVLAEVKGESTKLIDGVAWSPDSTMVAVLKHASESRFRPGDFLSALSGHPVPQNAYYLEIAGINGQILVSSKITSGIVGSWGEIVWSSAK